MVRHFPILENSETELSVDPRNGRRNNTTRSALAYYKRIRTLSEHRLCPQRGGHLTSLTVNINTAKTPCLEIK